MGRDLTQPAPNQFDAEQAVFISDRIFAGRTGTQPKPVRFGIAGAPSIVRAALTLTRASGTSDALVRCPG